MIHFSLRQLEYLVAAAHHGGAARAAQALHVSQPSISKAIAELEALWGERLFVRLHARGLEVTAAGAVRVRQARAVLRQAESLLAPRAVALQGLLRVGCLSTLGPRYLPDILSRLRMAHPDIEVQLIEGDIESLTRQLERGSLDVAVFHIAEQTEEVDACIAWSGQRPVAWLLDLAPVDRRWCLVHATHMDADEYARAATSGAVTGLCPSTEANLGDGIFDLPAWHAAAGSSGIGSDSHICVNAAEELMLLEYSQRLATRQRNVAAIATQPQVASAMTLAAVQGGAQAAGRPIGGIAVGQQADFVVLDALHPALQGLTAPDMLSAHVFASHRSSAVDAVWVGGQRRVTAGRHLLHPSATAGFIAARSQLLTS